MGGGLVLVLVRVRSRRHGVGGKGQTAPPRTSTRPPHPLVPTGCDAPHSPIRSAKIIRTGRLSYTLFPALVGKFHQTTGRTHPSIISFKSCGVLMPTNERNCGSTRRNRASSI